jgi:putative transposase
VTAVAEVAPRVGVKAACEALVIPRASFYRVRAAAAAEPWPAEDSERRPRRSPRALTDAERERVLELLHSDRFVDSAPEEVYATLLDEQTYLCAPRTMYRILHDNNEARERRNQLRRPAYAKPELLATRPNEVWSWDITKLLGPAKWTYFYLYVILDIFSRYVTGWMVAHAERTALAERLIAESCAKEAIEPGELTLHADRGPSMTSKPVAFLLADLGVTKTHNRPYTSADNPFSESHFKTLKYRPEFPRRFDSIRHARDFCATFFPWYNFHHRHSGIAYLTPHVVHHRLAEQVLDQRRTTLETAHRSHPERFVRGVPTPPQLPDAVYINPPTAADRNGGKDLETQ